MDDRRRRCHMTIYSRSVYAHQWPRSDVVVPFQHSPQPSPRSMVIILLSDACISLLAIHISLTPRIIHISFTNIINNVIHATLPNPFWYMSVPLILLA
jgi:hypothetical protein